MTPHVKICGITRAADAALAADLGACAIGFVFWPASPRFIDPYRARRIAATLPPCVTPVGVFVDQPADYVAGVAGLLALGAVQLHGSETVDPFLRLGCRVIKAVPVGPGFDARALALIPAHVTVLLDAHDPAKRGGTGRAIDWDLAAAAAATRRTILSGGLNAANVRAAIDRVRPYMIDVSSGVESSPGVKDPGRMRELFGQIHD